MPPSSALKSPCNFDLVVAMDRAGGIAKDGTMPWHLPQDLAYFAKLTTGSGNNAVLMGRKTWQSIPERFRPLPQRRNLVLSRQANFSAAGAETVISLENALQKSARLEVDQIFVIGGAAIYALALQHPGCRDLFITEIDQDFGCQVFFPALDGFSRHSVLKEENFEGLNYRFTQWVRTRTS